MFPRISVSVRVSGERMEEGGGGEVGRGRDCAVDVFSPFSMSTVVEVTVLCVCSILGVRGRPHGFV